MLNLFVSISPPENWPHRVTPPQHWITDWLCFLWFECNFVKPQPQPTVGQQASRNLLGSAWVLVVMADHLTYDHLNVMVSGCPQLGVLDRNLAMGGCHLIPRFNAGLDIWFGAPRDSCYAFPVNLTRQVAWEQTTPLPSHQCNGKTSTEGVIHNHMTQ